MLNLPPVTRAIIIANVVVFLLQQVTGTALEPLFALWSIGTPYFEPWQLLTYGYMHGGLMHIFFNMFALYMFGAPLEMFWGGRRFAFYYTACILTAAATELLVLDPTDPGQPVVGASGG
ncbi:MAG TPA: rhomboid family intramembrane serine protease, partial [Steroidobacteraceae bacterium]